MYIIAISCTKHTNIESTTCYAKLPYQPTRCTGLAEIHNYNERTHCLAGPLTCKNIYMYMYTTNPLTQMTELILLIAH